MDIAEREGERGRPAHAVAANEALEEAGISGDIQKRSIGTFYYRTPGVIDAGESGYSD